MSALQAVDLSIPAQPELVPDGVILAAPRNSCADFAMRLDCSQLSAHPGLRLPRLAGVSMFAYQVLPASVDLNAAAFVRQTGEQGQLLRVPRVLLPLPVTGGAVDLNALRDPANPSTAGPPAGGSVLIWIDLNIAPEAIAGAYTDSCSLSDNRNSESAGSVPIHLTIEDITLPTERHLHFASPLEWSDLVDLHPAVFSPITPRLVSRDDTRSISAIALLDQYMQLAHENGADFFIPRLQPVVKWPLGKMPEVDWSSFDSLTSAWFNGRAFNDGAPVGFWPLPAPDSLGSFDLASQVQYWQRAAEHFEQMQWLDRSPVVLHSDAGGPITEADSILLSAEARQILGCHSRLSAMLPLQDDQLALASAGDPSAIALASTSRLLTVSPGLVYPSPLRDWPTDALPPRHWIDATGQSDCVQTTGLQTEQGVRSLAWLAFLRDASLILCDHSVPVMADGAPPTGDRLIWCYPGEAFGSTQPLATLQLKWIRQAEQDYEILLLASQNGNRDEAMRMCRLICKPVQLQPAQAEDPLFDLLAGTTDPHASRQARQLLIDRLTEHFDSKNQSIATDPVSQKILRWFTARQMPTLVATSAEWKWNLSPGGSAPADPGNWIDAQIGVDLYNSSDQMNSGNQLEWTTTPGGFEPHPPAVDIPALAQYQVQPFTTTARFNLDKISPDSRDPAQLTFVDGFNGQTVPCKLVLPVAVSQRRQDPLVLDGSLSDWFAADAIQLDQPLVRMLNRPAVQSQDLQMADAPASLYTSWSDDDFYLAFRLGGVATADLRSTRNFVQYDQGRAWGEDLCELLIQPVYIDNSTGPMLHVVCKPAGNWVEQQPNPGDAWQPFEACGIRYASGLDTSEKIWRGEVAIPWKAIASAGRGRPELLRFNFIQHQNNTGQCASWAGPIDQSRDGKIMGLLVLK